MTKSRWPSPDLVARAVLVDDLGPVAFVTTQEAARFLALSPHSLECYRAKGTGPAFYKFGKAVRYAVNDLDAWTARCRHSQTAGSLPIIRAR
jgi:hypothetical protein